MAPTTLECVANISEGRDRGTLADLAGACGDTLIDLHSDPDHHRSVFTLAGPAGAVQSGARSLARAAVRIIDLTYHEGAHPRFGVVDVVPFVPLDADLGHAVEARDAFATWAAETLGLPCFLYGPLPGGTERSLPEVRKSAFSTLQPDCGPAEPYPAAGAVAVGARPLLVAYNVWLDDADPGVARRVAAALRSPSVRALGFDLDSGVQVSCNLLEPLTTGPAGIYDRVDALLRTAGPGGEPGGVIRRAELVGLVPAAVLERIPPQRWAELGLSPDRTIEFRLGRRSSLTS